MLLKFKFLLWQILLLSLAFNTQASSASQGINKIGNGGDVVVCKNSFNKNEEIQLLDFYENKVELSSTAMAPEEILKQQLKLLQASAPKLATQYLRRLSELPAEIEYKSDVRLSDIKDSKHLYQPNSTDCNIVQIAVRKNDILPGEKRFIIRKDLWDRLRPLDQAGLLAHEIIFEHLSKLGEEDSIKARKINAFLFSKNVDSKNFWNLIKNLKLPIYP